MQIPTVYPSRFSRAIPADVRDAVVTRDGMVCRRCGITVVRRVSGESYRPDELQLDHRIPWAQGGDNTEANLIVCCGDCNLGRPRPPKATVTRTPRQITPRIIRGDYYWPPKFRPPLTAPITEHPFLLVTDAVGVLGQSAEEIVFKASRGLLIATDQPLIRVAGIPPRPQRARARMAR